MLSKKDSLGVDNAGACNVEMGSMETVASFNVLGVTFETVNRLLLDGESDAVLLYVAYTSVAFWQKTYRPRATNNFMMKKLQWGKVRLANARKALEERGIIGTVQDKGELGEFGKVYVEVRHIVGLPKPNLTAGSETAVRCDRHAGFSTTSTLNTSRSTLNTKEVHSASPKKNAYHSENTPIQTKQKETEGALGVDGNVSKRGSAAADESVSGPEAFDSNAYAKQLRNDTQAHIKVIGWYFLLKGMRFPTKKAADVELRRNLKSATIIADYFTNDTLGYRKECEEFFPSVEYEWTLETVLKKLPEIGLLNKK